MVTIDKIGFGGGCHWCTEAVFQSLNGVEKVEQGWIASEEEASTFSEAVIVYFDVSRISLAILVKIHLLTHKSTSAHSMRKKYRSAIYYFDEEQQEEVNQLITDFQYEFNNLLITKVLPYSNFKPSGVDVENYYYRNPGKPFCTSFIDPKLKLLLEQFSIYANQEKLKHLNSNSHESIKKSENYFNKKEGNQETGAAPAGVCPNCWGKQEWDGEYYKFMKGQNGNPSEETYNNFVQDVARKLDKITLKENTYTCETCNVNYKE